MSAFDMGEAVRPSALIKTARWSLLLVGIWYGHKRYNQLKIQEDEIRAYNARMKPIWDKEKAEKAAKLNRENMLALAKEVGVKMNPNNVQMYDEMNKDIISEAAKSLKTIAEKGNQCYVQKVDDKTVILKCK